MDPAQLLARTYAAFNARDIDGALAALHPVVDWPNGMDTFEDGLTKGMEIRKGE